MDSPPLSELSAFLDVARLRSFRAAGKLRGVSASSLSEAMRRLEARLEMRLLNRTTRSVTLTEAGQKLFERVEPILSEVEIALDDINSFRQTPRGRLRLNVPGIVGQYVLPDIICRFLALYPDINVEMTSNDSLVDVLGEGFDAGVRYEEALHQDMIAIPIGPRRQRYVGAAAPAYLAAHGTPRHPRDLTAHAAILHRFANGRTVRWQFERDSEILTIDPPARVISDTNRLELAAAKAGLGIIFTFSEFVAEAIARGELIEVMPDWMQEFSGPFLYFHSRRYMPAPLRAFVDFVRADRAPENPWPPVPDPSI